jgi:heme-degrading monooxygenase HmoA
VADLSNIVKAYDVRGVVPDQLNADIARALGAAWPVRPDAARLILGAWTNLLPDPAAVFLAFAGREPWAGLPHLHTPEFHAINEPTTGGAIMWAKIVTSSIDLENMDPETRARLQKVASEAVPALRALEGFRGAYTISDNRSKGITITFFDTEEDAANSIEALNAANDRLEMEFGLTRQSVEILPVLLQA